MFEKRGFFDSPFDFNGDGRIDAAERVMAFKIFEDCIENNKSDKSNSSDVYCNASDKSVTDIFVYDPYFSDSDNFDK